MVEVQVVASARVDAVLELNHIHAHQVIGRVVGFAVNIELYVADGDVRGGELGAVGHRSGCWDRSFHRWRSFDLLTLSLDQRCMWPIVYEMYSQSSIVILVLQLRARLESCNLFIAKDPATAAATIARIQPKASMALSQNMVLGSPEMRFTGLAGGTGYNSCFPSGWNVSL